jgi:hypothetical protein
MKHLALAVYLSGASLAQEFPANSMHVGPTEVTATNDPASFRTGRRAADIRLENAPRPRAQS